MMKPTHSLRKIFQFFAVGPDENRSDVGKEDTKDDPRYLEGEITWLLSRASSHDTSRPYSSSALVS